MRNISRGSPLGFFFVCFPSPNPQRASFVFGTHFRMSTCLLPFFLVYIFCTSALESFSFANTVIFLAYLKYKTVTRLKGITNATKVEHIIKYKGALAFSFQGTAHQAEAGISSPV